MFKQHRHFSRRVQNAWVPSRRCGLWVVVCLSPAIVQAKDLPRRQAEEPRTADRACAYLGEGYTRAPGSDTCIKVNGHVRAEGGAIWGR